MANSRSLQQAVRFALATITASAGVTTLHAQTAPAQPAEATAAPLQEVVVTGSRLKTPNETAISPISTVTASDITATGLTRVEDVLNNLPMVFAGMNSTTSNGADGTASIDLRGLGNERTLVLVNGRRLGPGTGDGRNYSDINQIPTALIERVDILTGGASSVYGADAVAGVVNFVLNTHFEGVEVQAGYHFNQHNNSDSAVQSVVAAHNYPLPPSEVNTAFGKYASVIMGSNFADNRGNATAYVTYDNQGPALQSKFDYSTCNLGPATATTLACGGSSTSAGGSFRAYNSTFGRRLYNQTVDPSTGTWRPFAAGDLYNFAPENYYQVPNERWTMGAFVNYEINSHATAYMELMFTRNTSEAQIAESGDFGNGQLVPCNDPLLTAAEQSFICSAANLAAQGNPTIAYPGAPGGAVPASLLYILRRNVEGGPRIATFQTNSARQVVGVRGDFADAWTYDVYAQHSSVDASNGNLNYMSNASIINSLQVVPNPATGAPTCVSVLNGSDTACVPWNIWAPGGVTPAALKYLSVPLLVDATTTEYVVDGSITGDLGKYGVQLPSASSGLQLNIGAEYRSESANFLPDLLSQQGNAAGSGGPTPPISGNFHVGEIFTELRLPLVTDKTGAEDLSLEGGYRYSDYTEGFTTNTYKIGLEWAPVRDIRIRGSFQRAVRAPNIGELYTPQTVGLDGSNDPCAAPLAAGSLTTLTTGYTFAQCALSGVTAAQFGNIAPNAANQYNGLLGGNPSLAPEVADTYSAGFVLTPRVVPNLSISVDYFNIKIDQVIGPIGGDVILSNCLNGVNTSFYCPLVHRGVGGSLWLTPAGYVTDVNANQGALQTEGIDIKASYRVPLPKAGSLLFGLEGTDLMNLKTTPVAGQGSYDCKGYFGSVCGAGSPGWRHVLNATWSTPWDAFDLTLRWRYIGSVSSEQTSSNPFLTGTPYAPLSKISAYNYFDLTGAFDVYKNIRLQIGVNNVMDKDPPLVVGADCSTSSPAGANCNGNTFPGVYDAMGRYWFFELTAKF
ncbi:MAG TPA: TonB-dependent receptor [Steroidobacteraceae bacterium]|nr:TonB-dependent receptor [Steroidobacteraceae bacterium]